MSDDEITIPRPSVTWEHVCELAQGNHYPHPFPVPHSAKIEFDDLRRVSGGRRDRPVFETRVDLDGATKFVRVTFLPN